MLENHYSAYITEENDVLLEGIFNVPHYSTLLNSTFEHHKKP